MEKVILGKDCVLDDAVGIQRPNDNQIVIGCSGSGKSMSILLPTILNMKESSAIMTYAKEGEAKCIAKYQKEKGYRCEIINLLNPEESTIGFDPLDYVGSYLDIENLSKTIVLADPNSKKNYKDVYWNDAASSLLTALILATIMTSENPGMADVLILFDKLVIREDGKAIMTSLDNFFDAIEKEAGECPAVSSFSDFRQLPYVTAGGVRDSLAKALRRMFPEPVRKAMETEKKIDFCNLSCEKMSLIIITSPVNVSLYLYAHLIFSTAIKEMIEFAGKLKEKRLPRNVKLFFDDFACAAKINDFSQYISIFRSAGISSMILCQSESQLRILYSESEASNIINNCSAYIYFPGGMCLTTCKSISERLDIPLTDVLYAPTGKVIVMRSGVKPVIVPRYDIFNSIEYKEYKRINDSDGEER